MAEAGTYGHQLALALIRSLEILLWVVAIMRLVKTHLLIHGGSVIVQRVYVREAVGTRKSRSNMLKADDVQLRWAMPAIC